jgi:hypothetical protein
MRRTVAAASVLIVLAAACHQAPKQGAFGTPTGSPRQQPAPLQLGNDQPVTPIELKDLVELTGNGIGDGFPLDRTPLPCGPAREDWSWTHVADLGLTWVRISVDPMEWQRAQDADFYSRFHVNRCQDKLVSLFARKNVEMVLTIVFWSRKLHAERPPDYGNEREVRLFLDYTRFLVRHFKDRIGYFEILNEAHVYVHLTDYLDLVRRAAHIIREEAPDARVVLDGTSSLMYLQPRHYLFGLLRSDVLPFVDAIALHPMYGASPQYLKTREYYEGYPRLVARIQRVADENGFAGEYFVEEMCWRTEENVVPGEHWTYTPVVAAKYYARAIVMHRGMGIWAGLGGEMYETIVPIAMAVRNLSTVLDGAQPIDLTVAIDTQAAEPMSYGFVLPGGDRMFALWTNGGAVDDDPGVPATLTFSGFDPTAVVGIDVINGVQQELITASSAAGLVIEDLLVKDSPIFVRLSE